MKAIVHRLLENAGRRTATPFAVRFADGGEFRSRAEPPAFTVVFRNARPYARIALFGHIGLLESYFDGDIDIEGNLAKAMAVGMEGGVTDEKPLVWVRNRWHEF